MTGQKMWKRPSSATENERRLTENRRAVALTQTPSGSDDEKDRRFRKKQRVRGISKELPLNSSTMGSRYVNTRENYDYINYHDDHDDDHDDNDNDDDYDISPTDEDKFERINRFRRDMHQRMLENDKRRAPIKSTNISGFKIGNQKKYPSGDFDDDDDDDDFVSTPSQTLPTSIAIPTILATTSAAAAAAAAVRIKKPNQNTTTTTVGMQELVFDGGFESDFNQSTPLSLATATGITVSSCTSTPVASATTPSSKSAFRFSNDFSEREKLHELQLQQQQQQHFNASDIAATTTTTTTTTVDISPTNIVDAMAIGGSSSSGGGNVGAGLITTPKLRFDDRVRVTEIDNAAAFEDDFSGTHFDFNDKNNVDEQWSLTFSNTNTIKTTTTTTIPITTMTISSILAVTTTTTNATTTIITSTNLSNVNVYSSCSSISNNNNNNINKSFKESNNDVASQQIHILQDFSTGPPIRQNVPQTGQQQQQQYLAPNISLIPDLSFVAPAAQYVNSFNMKK